MRYMIILIMSVLPLSYAAAFPAQPNPDCWDHAMNTRQMNACAKKDNDHANAVLSHLMQKLRQGKMLSASQEKKLPIVENAWAKYQTQFCHFKTNLSQGGTIHSMNYLGCLTSTTWQHISALKILLCEGQGATGPCKASKQFSRE